MAMLLTLFCCQERSCTSMPPSNKKCRDRGNKDGAVQGFHVLQAAGLGRVIVRKPQRGTNMANKTISIA